MAEAERKGSGAEKCAGSSSRFCYGTGFPRPLSRLLMKKKSPKSLPPAPQPNGMKPPASPAPSSDQAAPPVARTFTQHERFHGIHARLKQQYPLGLKNP